jgi:arabinofuranosyltransferase
MTSSDGSRTVVVVFLLTLFLIVVVRNAWISDDAYITFRTVDNFVNGYGLTWNIAERVQAYTSPLWMFLMSAAYWFTREAYYTTIFLSIVISLGAAALLAFPLGISSQGALLGISVLAFSKTLVDYSTSGLENPLTHLIAAAFVLVYFQEKQAQKTRWLFMLSLTVAIGALNRLDSLFLLLPGFCYGLLRLRSVRCTLAIIVGFAPIILWEAFSIFYYGFPLPNTAYAKLNIAISRGDLVHQGLLYLLNSLTVDPLTLLVIVSAATLSIVTRQWRHIPIVAGIILHLVYVVSIGGDFMTGRFLSAPLFLAVALLSRGVQQLEKQWLLLPFSLVLVVSLSSPCPPLLSGTDYTGKACDEWNEKWIADERGSYYQQTGLLRASRIAQMPTHEWVDQGLEARRSAEALGSMVVERGSVGFFGFYAGPKVHVIDKLALADPLLARLPPRRTPDWSIGHYARIVPDGYVETIRKGRNVIADEKLARFYDKLSLVTRGGLFDVDRLQAILKMNAHGYRYLIDRNEYLYPWNYRINLVALQWAIEHGAPWDGDGIRIFEFNPVTIHLGRQFHASKMEISLCGDRSYQVIYSRGDIAVGRQDIRTPHHLSQVMALIRTDIPRAAVEAGFDMIRVEPLGGGKNYSLGHLRLIE